MFHQAIADRLGLNLTDHKCVDFLLTNGPMTAGELAAMTALTTGAITAAIDRLEKAGFVRREDDPADRRRVILRAVPERVGEIGQLFEAFSARLDQLASRYTLEELSLLVEFMTGSCHALRESAVELRRHPSSEKKRPRRSRG